MSTCRSGFGICMKCVVWRHVDLSLGVWYMYEVCDVATCRPVSQGSV